MSLSHRKSYKAEIELTQAAFDILVHPLLQRTTTGTFAMILAQFLSAVFLVGSATAHVRMTAISINGGAFVTNSVRLPPSNSPVTNVSSVSNE